MLRWTWDGHGWSQSSSLPANAPTFPGPTVALPDESGLLMATSGGTWTGQGTHWTRRDTATGLTRRSGYGLAVDAAHHAVVLFGGRTGAALAADTWTWDGSHWNHRGGPVPPTPSPFVPGELGGRAGGAVSVPDISPGSCVSAPPSAPAGTIITCAIP
jgi:hypothetical protein